MDSCDGSPLTDLDHYEVPIFRATIIGFMPCSVDDPTPCPIYARGIERIVTNAPTMTLSNPRPGEVLGWLWPEAIDTAGNSSALCEGAP